MKTTLSLSLSLPSLPSLLSRVIIVFFIVLCVCACVGGGYGYRRYSVRRVYYQVPPTTTVVTTAANQGTTVMFPMRCPSNLCTF